MTPFACCEEDAHTRDNHNAQKRDRLVRCIDVLDAWLVELDQQDESAEQKAEQHGGVASMRPGLWNQAKKIFSRDKKAFCR